MSKINYCIGVGKRKKATATVFLREGKGEAEINGRNIKEYFSMEYLLWEEVYQPLKLIGKENDFNFKVRAKGGGYGSQAEASRLALVRALLKFSNNEYRALFKSFNLLGPENQFGVRRKRIGHIKFAKQRQYSKR